MMMPGGPGRMLNTETQKPKNVSATLARFWLYFRPWWYAVALTLVLIVVATVLQVATAPLIGQAVDCYLLPNAAGCWYATVNLEADTATRMAGLAGLVGVLLICFVAGSALQGLAFYSMNWAGQRALRRMREDTFAQIHRLSLGFYARAAAPFSAATLAVSSVKSLEKCRVSCAMTMLGRPGSLFFANHS